MTAMTETIIESEEDNREDLEIITLCKLCELKEVLEVLKAAKMPLFDAFAAEWEKRSVYYSRRFGYLFVRKFIFPENAVVAEWLD